MKKDETQSTQVRPAATRWSSWTHEGSSSYIPSRIMGAGLTGPRHQVRIESVRLNVRLLSDIFDEHLVTNGGGIESNWEGNAPGRELIASM